jgi:hypothetical protein
VADLELELLTAAWNMYKESPRYRALLEPALDEATKSKSVRDLLVALPKAVDANSRLAAPAENLLVQVREFDHLISKVSRIPKLIQGELVPPTEEKRLLMIRECSHLLSILQNTDLMSGRLGFRLAKWVREQFVGFADLFLRLYQEEKFTDTADNLEEAKSIVLAVLEVAQLEPIEINLGKTPFDSTKHIGRSTTSRPGMHDGTIASVIKNGFRQVGGVVVQQPEVIINRM